MSIFQKYFHFLRKELRKTLFSSVVEPIQDFLIMDWGSPWARIKLTCLKSRLVSNFYRSYVERRFQEIFTVPIQSANRLDVQREIDIREKKWSLMIEEIDEVLGRDDVQQVRQRLNHSDAGMVNELRELVKKAKKSKKDLSVACNTAYLLGFEVMEQSN
jgi:hypothetical protein